MMPLELTDLLMGSLLFVAIAIGWLLGRADRNKKTPFEEPPVIPREHFHGINLLLNDKQDEAVEVFLRTLEINEDTVDTYLVMGSLFRRRGQVDRAIHIHQDLLARPSLNKQQQTTVRLELARDYLKAGLLDHSESILKELVGEGETHNTGSLEHLLSIYEQEQDWHAAISTASRLVGNSKQDMTARLGQYHCEVAAKALQNNAMVEARSMLKKALQHDKSCVRASLLSGQLEFEAQDYKKAIKALEQVRHQDDDYLPEALDLLDKCYQALGQPQDYVKYLFTCLEHHSAVSIVLALSSRLDHVGGDHAGAALLAQYLKRRPSARALHRLIDFHIANSEGSAKENLSLLQDFTRQLISNKPVYRCNQCGFQGKSLHWHCPSCQTWGAVKPIHGLEGE